MKVPVGAKTGIDYKQVFLIRDTGQFAERQFVENWLRENLPIKFRQIVFHVRQIGFRQIVFQQIVLYPVFAPAKRLK